MTFTSHSAIRVWMHVDERSAAYFALGMAKRLQRPVALVCTSGTAAANFLPAVVEAKLTHVPLLVLTADRPHELRDNGAPQAIDQLRLYGTHVKWFVDVALPEATNAALRSIRTLACRASALTLAVPAGPVHLNMPFREPLMPDPIADQPLPPAAQRDAIAWEGRADNAPYVAVQDAALGALEPAQLVPLRDLLATTPQGLIVVGPGVPDAITQPLLQLARRLDYPVLADPLSQLRCGAHDRSLVLASYDAFLRLNAFTDKMVPRLVLRFGGMPTAKPLLLYLQRHAAVCRQVVVDAQSGWQEPTQLAEELIHADPVVFCQQLFAALAERQPSHSQAPTWLQTWLQVDLLTRQTLQAALQDFPRPFEGRVFTELAALSLSSLYVSNSMPVRDLDTFFWGSEHAVRIVGNRGANGIDGVVSSALGFSATGEQSERAVLVIGDLAFLHDLNGLLAARLHGLHLTIVLVNNDGGGIFSFLSQTQHPEHFEQLFGTPTGLDFAPAVQMYGGHFQHVESWEQFRSAVQQGLSGTGLHVVEVTTERDSNVAMHRQLWQAIEQTLVRRIPALQAA
jgi:2-succinyl-5-enolpyruvyl-6-hydroxy-3-cyclohexene-1-carboxylate synthase